MKVYFGSFTNQTSKGIYSATFTSGKLSDVELYVEVEEPSFLLMIKNQIYSIMKENASGFCVIRNGKVIEKHLFESSPSCFISYIDDTVFLSNYFTGETHCYKDSLVHTLSHGDTSHPHFYTSKILIFLGKDQVIIDSEIVSLPNGTGPRHACVSRDNKIYVNTEYSNEVYVIEDNVIKNVYKSTDGRASSGAIKLSVDEQYLYVTNRGIDTVSVFKILKDGSLTKIQEISTYGKHPRDLSISPCGRYVLIANTWNSCLSIFNVNAKSGKLSFLESYEIPEVSCICFES